MFSRSYWSWKTTAFADASHLYAVRLLAQAYTLHHPENALAGSSLLLQHVHEVLEAWVTLQHDDGSFDQVFPNERSVGATAYTLSGVLDAREMLGRELSARTAARLEPAIRRAGRFLLENREEYGAIANHQALFAVVYEQLYRHTDDSRFRELCAETVRGVYDLFCPEGWFSEYGGADPGYQTQCLHYLARLEDMGFTELTPALDVAIRDFMPCFIHPDGSLGGRYGARLTAVAYPGGLAQLAGRSPEAAAMTTLLATGYLRGTTPTPKDVDLPNALRLASNCLDAYTALSETPPTHADSDILPCQRDCVHRYFPKAGLLAVGTRAYYAVIGLQTGGAAVAFDKATGQRVHENLGYTAQADGHPYCTHVPGLASWNREGDCVVVRAPFSRMGQTKMTPLRHVLLLLCGLTLFRFRPLRELAKKLMVRLLVKPRPPSGIHLTRTISLAENAVTIRDDLPSDQGLSAPTPLCRGAAIHMASAEFFDFSPLAVAEPEPVPDGNKGVETVWRFPVAPNSAKPEKKQRLAILADSSAPSIAAVNRLVQRLADWDILIVEENLTSPTKMVRTFASTVKKRGMVKTVDIVMLLMLRGLQRLRSGSGTGRHYTPDIVTHDVNSPEATQAVGAFAPHMALTNRCSLLTAATLEKMPCPVINNHPGITPRYRGAGSMFALTEGEFGLVGTTIHHVDSGIDTGSPVAMQTVDADGFGLGELDIHLMELGADLAADHLQGERHPLPDWRYGLENRLYLRPGLSDYLAALRGLRRLNRQSSQTAS